MSVNISQMKEQENYPEKNNKQTNKQKTLRKQKQVICLTKNLKTWSQGCSANLRGNREIQGERQQRDSVVKKQGLKNTTEKELVCIVFFQQDDLNYKHKSSIPPLLAFLPSSYIFLKYFLLSYHISETLYFPESPAVTL